MAAAAMLGVDPERLHLAGYEAGTLRGSQGALAAAIGKLLVELDPAEVFAPSCFEADDDRRVVQEAVRRAVVESGSSARLVSYRLDSWSDPPGYRLPAPGEVEAVQCERFLYLKQAALEAYASRTTNPTDEFGWEALSVPFVALHTGTAEVFFLNGGATEAGPVPALPVSAEHPGTGRSR